jgi:DNA processing protein
MAAAPTLPAEAWLVALAGLPQMGPRRLGALLAGRAPAEAWRLAVRGEPLADRRLAEVLAPRGEVVVEAWRRAGHAADVEERWSAHVEAAIGVEHGGTSSYPDVFRDDPDPPHVLFHSGDLGLLDGPRVAIVGTRRCSRYGADVAFELGRALTEAGVRVVSGLAVGIDGAAHAGTIDAMDRASTGAASGAPIAVVGSGLDVVYPRAHRALWRRVAGNGLLLSEHPLGCGARAWHFPARNRLIAALADIVVVVESGRRGGSLYTVDEAERRDRTVMAVPGPITSATSEGTNLLLADRAQPCLGVETILLELELDTPTRTRGAARRTAPSTDDVAVLDGLGWEPTTLEHLALRTGRAIGELVESLDRLESSGWVAQRGGWWERIARQ